MKHIILGGLAISALLVAAPLSVATAADMPLKAPPLAPAPVWSWTGWYVGVNAGGGWENNSYTTNLTNCNVTGVCGAGLVFGVPANQALGSALGTGSSSHKVGFIGGVQAGYNLQFSSTLVGLEADWDYFNGRNVQGGSGINSTGNVLTVTNQSRSNWLATVRPRVGLVQDHFLVYVTGGVAITNIKYTDSMVAALGTSSGLFSVSQTKAGWTVGGGVEYALMNNWSVKAEYLYAQFTGLTGTGALVSDGSGRIL